MKTSEQLDSISTALAKAQAEMKPAIKDSLNPAYKSKYADLSSVWDACRVPLTSNGIAVLQEVTGAEAAILVTTRLQHSSGQWIELGPLPVPVNKHDAHGVGSATSYGKRYGLAAAIGVIAELDDDGNAAVEARPTAAQAERASSPKMTEKAIADLMANLDEATGLDDLRERTRKALAVAQQGGDIDAHKRITAHGSKVAKKFTEQAA